MPLSTSLLLTNFAVKSVVVLGITAVAAYCLRRKSAATVHRIWTLGFAVLLAAPAAGLVLPQRGVEVVPPMPASSPPVVFVAQRAASNALGNSPTIPIKSSTQAAPLPPDVSVNEAAWNSTDGERKNAATRTTSTDKTSERAGRGTRASIVAAVWVMIAGVLLSRLAFQYAILARLLKGCTPLAGENWASLAAEAARRLGLVRPVRLVTHAAATTPATAGAWKPTILLPSDADRWTPSQRRLVLLHELAHVKRFDVLWQFVAGAACAIHWFNPLAWYGLAQTRRLRELACDDLVLDCRQPPADYAETLLQVARTYRPLRLAGTIGMARGTNVERRILAILDGARNRLPLSRRGATALAVVATTLILGVGSVRLENKSAIAAETPQGAADAMDPEKSEEDPEERTLEILITDEAGSPLPGASLHASVWEVEGRKDYANRDFTADKAGKVRVPIPRRLEILRLWPADDGFVPGFLNFAENTHGDGERIPERIHFKLARGTKLSGRIVNEAGEPIAGAKVEVSVEVREPAWGPDPKPTISTWLTDTDFNRPAPITDVDGRWSIDDAPAPLEEKDYEFRLKVTHDDYARDSKWGEFQRQQGITTAMLRAGTATITLSGGVTVEGAVVDLTGKPVTKGLVIWSDRPYWAEGVNEAPLDAEGRFRTIPLMPGEYPITIAAPGFQPVQRKVQVADGMEPLKFELPPGKRLVVNFVDRRGQPVPDVYVGVGYWRGTEAIYNEKHPNVPESGIPRLSDVGGVYIWDWAPDDAVTYRFGKKGYAGQQVSLVAKSTPHVITLHDERVTAGTVTDAETGQLLAKFTAMPVIIFQQDFYHTRREDVKEGRDGRYELPLTGSANPDDRYRVRFEADGYESLVSEESFGPLDGRATLNVALKPAPARTGQVLDHAGQPVAGALVFEASPTDVPSLSNNEADYDVRPVPTDAQGNFSLKATSESVLVRAVHDRGFVEVRREPGEPIGELRLRPWARLEGALVQDGRPIANETIIFSSPVAGELTQPRFQDSYHVQSDPDGEFVFDRLPPIRGYVRASLGPWRESPLTSAESAPLALQPGERRTVILGGEGAAVTGKVVPTGRGDVPLDAHWSLNYLVAREGGPLPPDFPALGFEAVDGQPIELAWLDDPHFQAWQATRRHYFVKLNPEGELRVSGVPAGVYDLVVQLYEQPAGCLVQAVGRRIVPIELTDAEVAAREKSIGNIEIPCRVGPRVGENMQAYKLLDADGREQAIFDLQGRFVLMHVWASWCGPCLEALPDMKAAVDELAGKPVVFAGLNVDADSEQAQALAEAKDWQWGHTYLGSDSDMTRQLAVSSVPAYYLIGPDGKLVASSNEWQQIKKTLEASLNDLSN